MLCEFCQSIVLANEDRGFRFRSASDIEQAAFSNCYFCHWILHRYRAAGNEADLETSDLRIHFCFGALYLQQPEEQLALEILIDALPGDASSWEGNRNADGVRRQGIEFVLLLDPQTAKDTKGTLQGITQARQKNECHSSPGNNAAARIASNTGHTDVAALAKAWFINCTQNHKPCGKNWDPSSFPKRLLSIHDDKVRLILTNLEQPQESYVTLSYCWGPNPQFLRLRADTIEDLMSGIPFKDLPRTFRHAITTARRLGIYKIWIDSLCIIQSGAGSEDDWEEQSGLMKIIYANSILNICASNAATAEEGFFKFRRPEMLVPCRLSKKYPATGSSDVREYTTIYGGFFEDQMLGGPTGQRGWILQE